jgi:hypothetical protein
MAAGAALGLLLMVADPAAAQTAAAPPAAQAAGERSVPPTTVTCTSKPGDVPQHCPASTGAGVVLQKSMGESPCLLGRTWGYDEKGVWVSDGCSATFIVAAPSASPGAPGKPQGTKEEEKKKAKAPAYVPNAGFLLADGEQGQIYMRLFTYARYLNQKGLDPAYTDAFGNSHNVQLRQDVQLNKFFLPFSGWFLTPKLRYYLYVWSSNPSQGDPAQVVGAGNLSYVFNRYVTFGAGIASLPTVRSTEGQFPYWLCVDDRLIADEFFRGSYTSGFWLKGEFSTKLKYMAMLANNLSTLGVSAAQLDNQLNTSSFMLQWLPSTGEFGLYGTFGDYDYHEKVATRVGVHYTHSREDKQAQPGTNSIENSQIRLTDGSIIFTPDLFGPGTTVDKVDYDMESVDAGVKYKGLSLEGEYYWRKLGNYAGTNVGSLTGVNDRGFQLQASAMVIPGILQVYGAGAGIFGRYGDASEMRAGANWYPARQRGFRINTEWIHLNKCPVGYTAVPYPVGGNGNLFHANLEMSF